MDKPLNKMHVGIVVQNDFPHVGEVRPRRLAKALHRLGHRVSFISWNSRKKPKRENIGYADVFRFDYFLKSRLFHWVSSPSALNPFWVFWVMEITRKERINILISSNIRIALPTIVAAKLLGKPIVLDLQENNGELVRHRPKKRLGHYITRNSFLVGILEKVCAKLSSHVWVVVKENLENLPFEVRKKNRVSVVCNTPFIDEVQASGKKYLEKDKEFTIIYVGRFTGDANFLELIFRSLPYVLEQDNKVHFLIGGVEHGRKELETLTEELGIEKNVNLTGEIEPDEVQGWLQQGDVGVIPYEVNDYTNSTISNKVFHYMAAGLPILSTDMRPTRRIIEEVGCGTIIPSGSDYRKVAEIILCLKDSPEIRAEMAEKGIKAIYDQYNWDKDFRNALNSLQQLIQEHNKCSRSNSG